MEIATEKTVQHRKEILEEESELFDRTALIKDEGTPDADLKTDSEAV